MHPARLAVTALVVVVALGTTPAATAAHGPVPVQSTATHAPAAPLASTGDATPAGDATRAAGGPAVGTGPLAVDRATDCTFPVSLVDATGARVPVSERPDDVVVLAPSAAQTMWALNASDQVVGMPVNRYTAYLNGSAEKADVVDSWGRAVPEKVIAADPDLVLAPDITDSATVDAVRDAGVPIYQFREATSLADVAGKVTRAGRLTGNCAAAGAAVAEMNASVATVRAAVADRDRPRVFYAMGGGWTAGPGSYVHDVIETAGGDNVAAELALGGNYGQVGAEALVDADPEWVIVGYVGDPPDDPASLVSSRALANTTAMEEGNVVAVNANYFSQPGPRVVGPLRTLADAFHPGALAAAQRTTAAPTTTTATSSSGPSTTTGTAVPTTDPGTTVGADPTGPTDASTTTARTTTASGGVPGFGPAVAALALAAVAAVASRHR